MPLHVAGEAGSGMSASINELLPGERLQAILGLLQVQGRVVASELATTFGVSEDSIRRDLRELAHQGKCRRVYGGALPAPPAATSLAERRELALDDKRDIGVLAAGLVKARQVLLIDAGSTNLSIVACLPEDLALTVVTNSPEVASMASARVGVQVVLLGGRYDARIGGTLGGRTLEQLREIRADLCFPGACALDAGCGTWAMDAEEAALKRAMIAASGITVIAATTEKLGPEGAYRVATADQVDHVLLDRNAPSEVVDGLRSAGIQVHQPTG